MTQRDGRRLRRWAMASAEGGRVLFHDGWSLVRIAIVGTLAYAALVVLLRVSGKRTLSKLNAFDFVITVALGSTLATVLLSDRVALAEGVVALALLVGLQYVASWLQVRSTAVERLLTSEPVLLFYRGEWLVRALRRERVTRDEVESAVRTFGVSGLEQVEAVVLEATGELSIVRRGPGGADLLPEPPPEGESTSRGSGERTGRSEDRAGEP